MKKNDEKLYRIWDERWRDSEKAENITVLGRLMFRAKKQALVKATSGLQIKTAIEVGCGLGHTLQFYSDSGYRCIGIDVSPNAIAVCRKKGLPAVLRNVEDINEQYDLVSSDGMLEHFLDFQPYAMHLMRISRCYVLLIQPNHDSFWGKTLSYLAELLRGNENVFEYNYRIMDFINVFKEHGFIVVNNLPIFFNVFRLVLFQKEE